MPLPVREHFYQTLAEQGAILVDRIQSLDHMPFEPKALHAFAAKCKDAGAQLLLCTEKDRVKLLGLEELPLPLASVKSSLSIEAGAEEWQRFISRNKSSVVKKIARGSPRSYTLAGFYISYFTLFNSLSILFCPV